MEALSRMGLVKVLAAMTGLWCKGSHRDIAMTRIPVQTTIVVKRVLLVRSQSRTEFTSQASINADYTT